MSHRGGLACLAKVKCSSRRSWVREGHLHIGCVGGQSRTCIECVRGTLILGVWGEGEHPCIDIDKIERLHLSPCRHLTCPCPALNSAAFPA